MRRLSLILITVVALFICCGGHDDPEPDPSTGPADQTILLFMPWAGDGLYPYLLKNITAMETAIDLNGGMGKKRLMVYLCTNPSRAMLIDIVFKNGKCVRDTVRKDYAYGWTEPSYTTTSGITDIFNEVKSYAPAKSYGIIVGCHAMGWVPKGTNFTTFLAGSKGNGRRTSHRPITRFYGNSGDSRQQAEVSSLASAVRQSFGHTDFILFDNCYMSTIEVAYDLRDVTDYLIASPAEVMGDGMPYATIGRNILRGDYNGIVDGFYNYYKDYSITFADGHTEDFSCGTLSVIKCDQLEAMASLMKTINSRNTLEDADKEKIQIMDGITPSVFFDMGDYLTYLCQDKDPTLLSQARTQLERLVTYKRSTGQFYSTFNDKKTPIHAFSGITISDPTNNTRVTGALSNTAWWKATH